MTLLEIGDFIKNTADLDSKLQKNPKGFSLESFYKGIDSANSREQSQSETDWELPSPVASSSEGTLPRREKKNWSGDEMTDSEQLVIQIKNELGEPLSDENNTEPPKD